MVEKETSSANSTSFHPIDDDEAGQTQIGVLLQATRERLGEDLGTIADTLRIRLQYLQAIEAGRYEELPGTAYAAGFIRSYAEYLGLNGEEVVKIFKKESNTGTPKKSLAMPQTPSETIFPSGNIIIISVVALLLLYGGWMLISALTDDSTTPTPPETVMDDTLPISTEGTELLPETTPQPLPAPTPAVTLEAPLTPPVPAVTPAPTGQTNVFGKTALTPPVAPTAVVVPQPITLKPDTGPLNPTKIFGTTTSPSPVVQPMLRASAETPATITERPTAPRTFGTSGGRIDLRAAADAWIQVTDKAGQIVFERVLYKDDVYHVPTQEGLLLKTGNGAGLDILVDGQNAPRLGGKTRSNVKLDPEALKNGTAYQS